MNPISKLYILAMLIFNFTNGLIYSQTAKTPKWTAQQIQSANTAKNIASRRKSPPGPVAETSRALEKIISS